MVKLTIGLYISIWVARYLGPEQFGIFNYAHSYVALFAIFSTLGLDGIVVRELVKGEYQRDELLGTSFILKLTGAFLVLSLLAILAFFQSSNCQTNMIKLIIASAIICQSFNVIDFYFQSKVLSKFVVLSNLFSFLISSLIKIILILNKASLITFAFVVLFDSFILMCGLLYCYIKNNLKIKLWKFNFKAARNLLKDSWPLIISSVAVTIYMKIDIIMLKEFLGEYQVGLYSASSRISELWYIVPVLVTTSFFPAILNAKKKDEFIYENRLANLYKIMIYLAIIFSILVSYAAPYFMQLAYGSDYNEASEILIIQVWSSVFISILMISNKWLLAENKTKFIFIRGLIGAIINIILNYIYIPIYGVQAAAYTSLVTLIFTSLIVDIFTASTRRHLRLKIEGFVPLLYRDIRVQGKEWKTKQI